MSDLQSLAETEHPDPEIVPEILPVDARLSVTSPAATLLAVFERIATVVPTKEIISGTAHALLQAEHGAAGEAPSVRLTGTDGEVTLSTTASGMRVAMSGAALVPAQKIAKILKMVPDPTVRIAVLGGSVIIRSGRAQWSVQTPAGDRLPPAPDVSGITTHEMPVRPFLDALAAVRKAASASSARASLMQISVRSGHLTALDGGRLHRQRVTGLPMELDLTIPLGAADQVVSLLRATGDETFRFGGNSSHLVFVIERDTLVAQRALVDFPNVDNQVLGPALTNAHTLTVNRAGLIDAVKRVRINADQDYQAVTLTLVQRPPLTEGPEWALVVSARDRIGATAQEAMRAKWSGPSGSRALTLNHRYLMDLLTTLTGDSATIRVGDDTKTARMPLYVDDQVSGFTGWVQQMRTGYGA